MPPLVDVCSVASSDGSDVDDECRCGIAYPFRGNATGCDLATVVGASATSGAGPARASATVVAGRSVPMRCLNATMPSGNDMAVCSVTSSDDSDVDDE